MFNLLTKLFGFSGKDAEASSAQSNDTAEKLRSKRVTQSSTSNEAIRPRESSKLGETTIPITTSRTNMKARSHWNQGYYDAHSEQTQQQQLNLLYAPPVGPIARSGDDNVWNSQVSLSPGKYRALNSYLTKANQEIHSNHAAESESRQVEPEQADFAPNGLTDTAEISLPRSTQEILLEMATHKDSEVRGCIAANELTPAEALWALAEDESPAVRFKLVSNIKCPIPLLELLLNDSNSEVALRAASTLRKAWKNRESAA